MSVKEPEKTGLAAQELPRQRLTSQEQPKQRLTAQELPKQRLTALRAWLNRWRRRVWRLVFFRMLFGERSGGQWRPGTRMSPSVCIEHEDRLQLADDVFIGHFCFIEASAGVRIGAGTQVTNYVSIVSHSTHRAVRVAAGLSGAALQEAVIRAPIAMGQRCFIGPHSTIEAGTVLGHGTLVAAHSRVRGTWPDFAVLAGSPARQVGDTREADARWLQDHPGLQAHYQRWRADCAQATTPHEP